MKLSTTLLVLGLSSLCRCAAIPQVLDIDEADLADTTQDDLPSASSPSPSPSTVAGWRYLGVAPDDELVHLKLTLHSISSQASSGGTETMFDDDADNADDTENDEEDKSSQQADPVAASPNQDQAQEPLDEPSSPASEANDQDENDKDIVRANPTRIISSEDTHHLRPDDHVFERLHDWLWIHGIDEHDIDYYENWHEISTRVGVRKVEALFGGIHAGVWENEMTETKEVRFDVKTEDLKYRIPDGVREAISEVEVGP